MIKNDKETEEYLKLLRKDAYPEPVEPGFSELVWAQVSNPTPPLFTFSPMYSLAAFSIVLFFLVWIYNQSFPVPHRDISREVPIVGTVLETSPNLVNQVKRMVEEGDLLATGSGQMTFFLPGVGYFHAGAQSKIQIKKARHESKTSGFQYELFVEEGVLYSKLSKLDAASSLNYLTPYGTASVLGTDFLLNVKKDSGAAIEVLNGVVKVASANHPQDYRDVQSGFNALLSPNANGTLLVTELEGSRLAELKDEFTEIFKGSRQDSRRNTSNFKILSQQEIRWKK